MKTNLTKKEVSILVRGLIYLFLFMVFLMGTLDSHNSPFFIIISIIIVGGLFVKLMLNLLDEIE